MSRLEDALRKLQKDALAPGAADTVRARASAGQQPAAIPVDGKTKVVVDSPRHHVDHQNLIAAGLLTPVEQGAATADEFRRIKRPLIENAMRTRGEAEGSLNVIMLTSALPGAGKTFCSVNLAMSISLEREINVLLVDADVAKPHISEAFGLAHAPGLIDMALDDACGIQDILVRTDLNNIQVLPAGRRHPQATELLASERMSSLMTELANRYPDRIILLDSPPLLATSAAQVLARHVGQIAFVVEAGKSNHQSVLEAIELLDSDKPVNVILNKNRQASETQYYGYYSGTH